MVAHVVQASLVGTAFYIRVRPAAIARQGRASTRPDAARHNQPHAPIEAAGTVLPDLVSSSVHSQQSIIGLQ